jgi:hypothetical protein
MPSWPPFNPPSLLETRKSKNKMKGRSSGSNCSLSTLKEIKLVFLLNHIIKLQTIPLQSDLMAIRNE